MNAPNSAQSPSLANGSLASDPKMEQIRELLIGEYLEATSQHFTDLYERVEQLAAHKEQVDSKLTTIDQRLDAIQSRVETLANEVTADNRAAFEELSKIIAELANGIREIPHR